METIRKQASKLWEQVAKQQQAVFKQFGGDGYRGSENVTSDADFHQHQRLEKLYLSTRATKHFQRDIVRGVDGYVTTGSKQVEIGTKLSLDSKKYGVESTCTSGSALSKAASNYGRARAEMEKERSNLLKALRTQVAEPLRGMVTGTLLEEARHLAQRHDRLRQEAETLAIEVSKRQQKMRESPGNADSVMKLEVAEAKLRELKSNAAVLGKESAAAMAAVEDQQQGLTLHRLIVMVESERAYHRKALRILDQLETQMVCERRRIEAAPAKNGAMRAPPPLHQDGINQVFASESNNGSIDPLGYFIGEVVHPYRAESDVELHLGVGDYVVVRKVSNNGWAEGECRGKAGWFPMAYVERRDRVLASKMAEIYLQYIKKTG